MITGFNTDIEFGGVTYHVQTEDKGLERPIILSLVYDRGTILASKRSPYDDLLGKQFDEKILAERLQKQHRLICAAVRAGRIEDLKKMTSRDKSARVPAFSSTAAPAFHGSPVTFPTENPIPKPRFDSIPMADVLEIDLPSMIDGVSVLDDNLLPEEAVAVVNEAADLGRRGSGKLAMELLGEGRFVSGQRRTVEIMLCKGANKVVPGAQIMAKILGSSFRPMIFHAVTDENGVASISINIPSFTSGRAVVLIRAISDGVEIELRRAISHT